MPTAKSAKGRPASPPFNESEESPIRLGYVPLADCAPIVVAHEWGLFEAAGVEVSLEREPGWASIRDKIVYGELDAAHALAGLTFAISFGLGTIRTRCCTGLLLNSQGDAITVSRALYEAGADSASGLAEVIAKKGGRLPLTFGVPHAVSSHHFLLDLWLRRGGLQLGRDVRVVALPPAHMPESLGRGHIDGYCVGEPFNSVAEEAGTGHIVGSSADLARKHPEKALLVTERFVEQRPEAHARLVSALYQACLLCDEPELRPAIVTLLAQPAHLGLDRELLERSLVGSGGDGGFGGRPEPLHVFSGPEVNCPSTEKASWILKQMSRCKVLAGVDEETLPPPRAVFRADLFAATETPSPSLLKRTRQIRREHGGPADRSSNPTRKPAGNRKARSLSRT